MLLGLRPFKIHYKDFNSARTLKVIYFFTCAHKKLKCICIRQMCINFLNFYRILLQHK